jgi:hypothetical protein
MKTIWKFPLEVTDAQGVLLPQGAQVLTAQLQGRSLCLWALVDPDAPKTVRLLHIFGTGHPVHNADSLRYISTFQLDGGALVFHVFEET